MIFSSYPEMSTAFLGAVTTISSVQTDEAGSWVEISFNLLIFASQKCDIFMSHRVQIGLLNFYFKKIFF